MAACESGGKGVSLLFGNLSEFHASPDGGVVRLWPYYEWAVIIRVPEYECPRISLRPRDQLAHVANGPDSAVHVGPDNGVVLVGAAQPGRQGRPFERRRSAGRDAEICCFGDDCDTELLGAHPDRVALPFRRCGDVREMTDTYGGEGSGPFSSERQKQRLLNRSKTRLGHVGAPWQCRPHPGAGGTAAGVLALTVGA